LTILVRVRLGPHVAFLENPVLDELLHHGVIRCLDLDVVRVGPDLHLWHLLSRSCHPTGFHSRRLVLLGQRLERISERLLIVHVPGEVITLLPDGEMKFVELGEIHVGVLHQNNAVYVCWDTRMFGRLHCSH
jgi:hypothetical protein